MKRRRVAAAGPGAALVALLAAGTSSADWPMARHDARRTGMATGVGDEVSPVVYWRYYLGGLLAPSQLLAADLDKDGKTEVVFVGGGRVLAKRADDTVVWQTAVLGLDTLWGAVDLDGDGKVDIIASSSDHVFVLAGGDGNVEWSEPDGEMGSLGGVRFGDVDGDGKSDVLIQECVCCGNYAGTFGMTYSFGKGYSAPTALWKFPFADCGGSPSTTIADLDGDSQNEVALGNYDNFSAVDGKTGKVLATTPYLGTRLSTSACAPVNVDGAPGDELVCILSHPAPPAKDQRRAFALKYSPKPTATFAQMWTKTLAPDEGGDVRWVNPVVDLDGDGVHELVVSAKDGAKGWSTIVADAATGATLASIPEHIVTGTIRGESPGAALIVTRLGTALGGWTFVRKPAPAVQLRWTLSNSTVFVGVDRSVSAVSGPGGRMTAKDLDGDGLDDLLATNVVGPPAVRGYSLKGGSPKLLGTYEPPPDVSVTGAWLVPTAIEKVDQLALMRNDGYLALVDDKLVAAQPKASGQPGVRVGQYYADGGFGEFGRAPRAAALDGTKSAQVVVRDSRMALLRLDAKTASLVSPPMRVWQKTHAFAPTIVPGLDGNLPGIVCFAQQEPVTDPPGWRVFALRADGTALWSQSVESNPMHDLVAGRIDDDGVPDILLQWGAPDDRYVRTRALAGTNGAPLWNATPVYVYSRSPDGFAVADWNGDKRDDVAFQGDGTHVLSGTTGVELAKGGPADSYYLPTVADIDGDGAADVVYHGGYNPLQVYGHDLATVVLKGTEADRPYPYGALAQCTGQTVFVEGSWKYRSRLKTTQLTGTGKGSTQTVVLAGGKAFADEQAAKAAGAFLGQLSAANVHANLTGAGRPTAVLGSSDGWLYGIDPCTGKLDFATAFGASVGEAVFADTDGDGMDEILVTTADGYLHDLRGLRLPAPNNVLDTDPGHGVVGQDVDSIETADTLSAKWDPVPGATSYEVAVVLPDGAFATSPKWTSVGTKTAVTLSGLPLKDGATYFFAVRAVGSKGPSVDATSDGVIVRLPSGAEGGAADAGPGAPDAGDAGADGGSSSGPAPDRGGDEGGCGCRAATTAASGGWRALVVLSLCAGLGRRRRRSWEPGPT